MFILEFGVRPSISSIDCHGDGPVADSPRILRVAGVAWMGWLLAKSDI